MLPEVRVRFWDDKIEGWDRARYTRANPILFRAQLAARLLAPHCAGKIVADLGCGCGRLLGELQQSGAARRIGVDFSARALELARRRDSSPDLELRQLDLTRDPLPKADLYAGLGLLDWLKPTEVQCLLQSLQGRPFLFSFSERVFHPLRWLHQLYVFLAYGWRTGGYVPHYWAASQVLGWAHQAGYREVHCLRHPCLSFGAFLSTLPEAHA